MLDTKSGSIQSIVLYDVTGFNAVDLIVGDSDGTVTLFSRRQMLSKRLIGAAITHLEMYEDLTGGFEIISGGVDGIVTSFHPHDSLWRCNIGEESARLYNGNAVARHSQSVRCLLSVQLQDCDGLSIAYLLVCDGRPLLHFLSRGDRIMTLSLPAIVNTMCAGFFYAPSMKMDADETYVQQQVALAGDNGVVYIMQNYNITSFFQVDYPVTRLLSFRTRSMAKNMPNILICAGHRNEIRAYHNGNLIATYETEDWPHDMTLGDIDADGTDELVLGLLNQTVQVLKCNVQTDKIF